MQLVADLTSIYERCRSAALITPYQQIQVKGPDLLLSVLQRDYPFIEGLVGHYESIGWVKESIRNWIAYLDKRYVEQAPLIGRGVATLEDNDARRLSEEASKWVSSIISPYSDPGTVLIKEESLDVILPDGLLSRIDQSAREDVRDALSYILHLLPTPAAMISLRVAEYLLRQYYSKVTGKSATGRNWSSVLSELEQGRLLKKSLIGYLGYLRDKRNEADHPEKRFDQEESERIFLQVKALIEEMN